MSDNAVLKQFLEMRRALYKESPAPATAATAPRKKKGKGTSEALTAEATENTLATLIEKKPGKKGVEEYFQRECNRLTTEKMA